MSHPHEAMPIMNQAYVLVRTGNPTVIHIQRRHLTKDLSGSTSIHEYIFYEYT